MSSLYSASPSPTAPRHGGRGRHRAPSRDTQRVATATAAVAAGAMLAGGYQLAQPAVADAVPVAPGQATPIAGGLQLPPGVELPQEVQNVLDDWNRGLGQTNDNLNQGWEQTTAPLVQPDRVVRPVDGQITSGFGYRWGAMHSGLDFADPIGTPIKSVSNGTVIEAGPASGFGLWVRVKQDDGTTAVYGHVNEILSHVGQRVNAGDVIATVGNRGNSTGPHLHLEIWDANGTKVDPAPWLANHGVAMHWGAD